MKKVLSFIFVAIVVFTLSGCSLGVIAPFRPPVASCTMVKAPLDINFNKTEVAKLRKGESSSVCVLGLVAFGDSSAMTAARNAHISVIEHADYSYVNLFWVYQKTKVIVYGK
jgi:predicted small lipoprotein YifL